jgi:hypothetical protein
MSSLLSSSEIEFFTGQANNLFETLSTGRNSYIEVYREPTQVINNNSSLNLYGYPTDSLNTSDITYSINSGRFPVVALYSNSISSKDFIELKFSLEENQIMAKVREDAKNYIQGGKVEYLVIDGQKFNIVSNVPRVQNYFNLKFYYFKLQATQ